MHFTFKMQFCHTTCTVCGGNFLYSTYITSFLCIVKCCALSHFSPVMYNQLLHVNIKFCSFFGHITTIILLPGVTVKVVLSVQDDSSTGFVYSGDTNVISCY